ncbi:hypothetical protein LTR53_010967 [Teratosphaeriaceae sp. CCFEE 6253]|nr:hypothetical protein LTR53_010967 [Teratosphaeriaceae sp. CCFEE 6253]
MADDLYAAYGIAASKPVDGPPPYDSNHVASHGADDSLKRAEDAEHQARVAKRDAAAEVERLRKFLLHALSRDYDCVGIAALSATDARHFRVLNAQLTNARNPDSLARLTAIERAALRSHLQYCFDAPCKALGITPAFVATIITQAFEFTHDILNDGAFARSVFRQYGAAALAQKVYRDTTWVIPRITRGERERRALRDGMRAVVGPYIESYAGKENLHLPSDHISRVGEVRAVRYVLTEQGQACEDVRLEALEWESAPPSIAAPPRHWAARMKDGVMSVFRRKGKSDATGEKSKPLAARRPVKSSSSRSTPPASRNRPYTPDPAVFASIAAFTAATCAVTLQMTEHITIHRCGRTQSSFEIQDVKKESYSNPAAHQGCTRYTTQKANHTMADYTESDISPPPYTAKATSPNHEDLLNRLHGVVGAPESIHDSASMEINRVRNLLLCAMPVDYQCNTLGNLNLSKSDRSHFSTMYSHLNEIQDKDGITHQPSDRAADLGPYFSHHLQNPCEALGIAVEFVAATILDFFDFQDRSDRYRGATKGVLRRDGIQGLARKIYRDGLFVIPQITRDIQFKRELQQGMRAAAHPYLVRIHGIHRATLPIERHVHAVQTFHYSLTEKGKAYEAASATGHALWARPRTQWRECWAARAQGCVARVLRKREESGDARTWPTMPASYGQSLKPGPLTLVA